MSHDDAFFTSAKAVDDEQFKRAWASDHPWCMICGGVEGSGPKWMLHTHHLLGGKHGRSDEACNFLRVHGQCHDLCHDAVIRERTGPLPNLSLGMQLTVKKLRDPESWDPVRLSALRKPWAFPELEPIPEYFVEQWEKNQLRRMAFGWKPYVAPAPAARLLVHVPLPWEVHRRAKQRAESLEVSVEQFIERAVDMVAREDA